MKFSKKNSLILYLKDTFLVKIDPLHYYPLYIFYKFVYLLDFFFFPKGFFIKKLSLIYPKNSFILKNSLGIFKVNFSSEETIVVSEFFEYFIRDWFNLQKNGIFLDIGSNLGIYSIYQGKKSFIKKIYAFEPNKITFDKLKKNISLNNLNKKVELINLGLGNKKSKIYFEYDPNSLGQGKVLKNKLEHKKNLSLSEIKIDKLDSIIKNKKIVISEVSFIKIDVEGYEMEVILGAINIFKNLKKGSYILIEIWDEQKNKKIIFDFFTSNNFKLKKSFGDNYLYIKK